MLCVIIQYLLSPVVFLLTFILPVVFYFVNRRYVWCSILLAVLVGLIINCGLMILVTLVQVAVMAIIILILRAVTPKRQK